MNHVIERLRASKLQSELKHADRIRRAARSWIEQDAEYDQLERIVEYDLRADEARRKGEPWRMLHLALTDLDSDREIEIRVPPILIGRLG